MKKTLKRILVFFITLLLSISNANSFEIVRALKTMAVSQETEIYEVKTDGIIINNIVDFYEMDPNKEEIVKYRLEQERLEQERLAKLELRNNIVGFSKQFIGNPYVLGGNSLINGIDCSGFVQAIYGTFGIWLPRTTHEQSIMGTDVSVEEIQIGDIVAYGYGGNVTHTALYIGDGMIIHASTPELGIRIDSIYIMPIITIRSII